MRVHRGPSDRFFFTGSLLVSLLLHLVLVGMFMSPLPSSDRSGSKERVKLDLVVESGAPAQPAQPAGRTFARRSPKPLQTGGHPIQQDPVQFAVELPGEAPSRLSEVPPGGRPLRIPDGTPMTDQPLEVTGESVTRVRVAHKPGTPSTESTAGYVGEPSSARGSGSPSGTPDRERVSVLGNPSPSGTRSREVESVRELVRRPPFPYDDYSRRLPAREYRAVYRIVINPDGTVRSLSVESSGGRRELAEDIAKWVQKWKYNPSDQSNTRRVVVEAMKSSRGS